MRHVSGVAGRRRSDCVVRNDDLIAPPPPPRQFINNKPPEWHVAKICSIRCAYKRKPSTRNVAIINGGLCTSSARPRRRGELETLDRQQTPSGPAARVILWLRRARRRTDGRGEKGGGRGRRAKKKTGAKRGVNRGEEVKSARDKRNRRKNGPTVKPNRTKSRVRRLAAAPPLVRRVAFRLQNARRTMRDGRENEAAGQPGCTTGSNRNEHFQLVYFVFKSAYFLLRISCSIFMLFLVIYRCLCSSSRYLSVVFVVWGRRLTLCSTKDCKRRQEAVKQARDHAFGVLDRSKSSKVANERKEQVIVSYHLRTLVNANRRVARIQPNPESFKTTALMNPFHLVYLPHPPACGRTESRRMRPSLEAACTGGFLIRRDAPDAERRRKPAVRFVDGAASPPISADLSAHVRDIPPAHRRASPARKAQLGEACDKDGDCDNKGSVCLRGMCQCHPFYVRMTSEKSPNGRCMILPSKINQDCSTKCREPLFCRNGKCQCVQRGSTFTRNGECISVTKVGDRCSRHYDCTSPFSACVNHQCVCISGTVQQGTKCVAATNCPLGGAPAGSCTRKASISQVSPPFTSVSITSIFSDPQLRPRCGHVCRRLLLRHHSRLASGPLLSPHVPAGLDGRPPLQLRSGRTAALEFDQTAEQLVPVGHPLLPLLVQRQLRSSESNLMVEVQASLFQAVCCKRPCNAMAPEALYLNGACVARGQLNSECQRDEQCGAAEGMECRKGQCVCSDGFKEYFDPITNPKTNPAQLCVRDCEKGSQSRDTTCLPKTLLGGSCFVQGQCPENSGCYRGRCTCSCGYRMTAANKCVKVEVPTTAAPPAAPIPNPNFIDIFNSFFGKNRQQSPLLNIN
ncbi:hypothetical protein M3Y99_01777200 [Aphelenchoides fujianensis]|nr:hypothetical protein M3Y99_01777200 [Aphelenchoides fujianensis]